MRSSLLAHLFHPRRSNNHRARVLHAPAFGWYLALAGLFLVGLQSSSWTQAGAVLGYASSITPAQIIELTNQERARQGLGTLVSDPDLTEAALKKGQDMMSQQYWAHVSPTGKEPWAFMKEVGYEYQAAGENLARDFGDTGTMVSAWMASPTHRANIVNSKYTQIGIAVIDGNFQGYETTLVVQMFGRPRVLAGQVEAGTGPVVAVEAQPDSRNAPGPTPEVGQALEPNSVVRSVPSPTVLARALVPIGSLTRAPLFSPLQLSKVFFLAIITLIVVTLVYDTAVIGHRRTMRLVGHNFGHIVFLMTVAFLIMLFKGGIVR